MKIKQTFKEWKDDGYFVIKGSKAVGFNEFNEPLFDEDQVEDRANTEDSTELYFEG